MEGPSSRPSTLVDTDSTYQGLHTAAEKEAATENENPPHIPEQDGQAQDSLPEDAKLQAGGVEESTEYVTGFKLVRVMLGTTIVMLLAMLDISILSTVCGTQTVFNARVCPELGLFANQ
jgi:hypothetical protein